MFNLIDTYLADDTHMNRKRYLVTNKPGHPDAYASVLLDFLVAPCMLLSALTGTLYVIFIATHPLPVTAALTITAIIGGAVIGALIASGISLTTVFLAGFFSAIITVFTQSVDTIRRAL